MSRTINRLVRSVIDKTTRHGSYVQDNVQQSDRIYNDMAGGAFFLVINDHRIKLTEYHDALAQDLRNKKKLSLSEVYDPTQFKYFLDIDSKLWDKPTNSDIAMKLYKSGSSQGKAFFIDEFFIKIFTEEVLKFLHLVLNDSKGLELTVTTTIGQSQYGFLPFLSKHIVCPYCNAELFKHSTQRIMQCHKCEAQWNRKPGFTDSFVYAGGCTKSINQKLLKEGAPFVRTKKSFGFHVRSNLVVNVLQAKQLSINLIEHLSSWSRSASCQFNLPESFFYDMIDLSVYGKGKGLRVVGTSKAIACQKCKHDRELKKLTTARRKGTRLLTQTKRKNGFDSLTLSTEQQVQPDSPTKKGCWLCNGKKKFLNKMYSVLGTCRITNGGDDSDEDAVEHADESSDERLDERFDERSQMSDDEFSPVSASVYEALDNDNKAIIQQKPHKQEAEAQRKRAYDKSMELDVSWTWHYKDALSRLSYPRSKNDFKEMLRKTSLRMVPGNTVVYMTLNEHKHYALPTFTELKNNHADSKIVQSLNTNFATPQYIAPSKATSKRHQIRAKNNHSITQRDYQIGKELLASKGTQRQNQSFNKQVPKKRLLMLTSILRGFDENYSDIQIDLHRPPVYVNREQTKIYINVTGFASNFCCIKGDRHETEHVWFSITPRGVQQRCYSTRCKSIFTENNRKAIQRITKPLCDGQIVELFGVEHLPNDIEAIDQTFNNCSLGLAMVSKEYYLKEYPLFFDSAVRRAKDPDAAILQRLDIANKNVDVLNAYNPFITHLPEPPQHMTLDAYLTEQENIIFKEIVMNGVYGKKRGKKIFKKMKKLYPHCFPKTLKQYKKRLKGSMHERIIKFWEDYEQNQLQNNAIDNELDNEIGNAINNEIDNEIGYGINYRINNEIDNKFENTLLELSQLSEMSFS